jgi:hypothetical protein
MLTSAENYVIILHIFTYLIFLKWHFLLYKNIRLLYVLLNYISYVPFTLFFMNYIS